MGSRSAERGLQMTGGAARTVRGPSKGCMALIRNWCSWSSRDWHAVAAGRLNIVGSS